MRKIVLSALTIAILGLVAAPVLARAGREDDAEVTRMAKEHYKAGLEAYQAGNYSTAIKELKKAYLLKHLPPLLLNIGQTYRKMGDNDNAISYYKKYLTEAPDAKDHGDVEKIVAELQSGGAKEPAAPAADAPNETKSAEATPPPAAEPAPAATAFAHTPVDAAPPDTPVDVRVTMPVMKGVKVYLYYRDSGSPDFTAVVMKRRGGEKVGRIPASAMSGKSIQYYIEAKDGGGNVVNHSGSQADPNIVMVDPNAKPVMVAGGDAGEAAPAAGGGNGKVAHADLDDEAAPIMGSVDEPHRGGGSAKASGGKRFGGAFYAGLVFVAAGAALVGSGAWALFQAQSYANALTADSMGGSNGMPYMFSDPKAQPYDDKTVEQRGRSYNSMGIGLTVGGSIAAVAGIVMIAVDQTVMAKRRAAEKPKRAAWYLSPSVGPTYAGLGGGVSF